MGGGWEKKGLEVGGWGRRHWGRGLGEEGVRVVSCGKREGDGGGEVGGGA